MSAQTSDTTRLPVAAGQSSARAFVRRMLRDPLGLIGLAIVILVILAGLFAPWITPFNPLKIDVPVKFQPPSLVHIMGTDQLGRDLFSRVIAGTRIAVTVGLTSIAISLAFGLVLGLIAGFGPRWLDAVLLLIFDSVYSFPTVMLGLAVLTLLGPSIQTLIMVVIIIQTPVYARLTRTATLGVKSTE